MVQDLLIRQAMTDMYQKCENDCQSWVGLEASRQSGGIEDGYRVVLYLIRLM
jgi:hypothetical protein